MGAAASAWESQAADRIVAFSIPAGSLSNGLVDFAVQANLSIGVEGARACRPNGPGLTGRYTVRQGLRRMLAGSGCTYRMVDEQTVRIMPALFSFRPPPPQPIAPVPAEPAAATLVDEIVVTSGKRSIGLDRAPYAVSAVSGESLAESAAVDTGDLAGRIAGLTVTNLGPGRNKLFVRGLSDGALTGRTQATVGLYVDDTRATYNAPDPNLRLIDIERVELLRGPQGSLYGAGSIGGVLQVITRQPEAGVRSGWLSATAAATVNGAPSGVIEGGFNMPLIGERLTLRAVGYRETTGGAINDVGLDLSNVDKTLRQGSRLNLLWDITPRWSAGLGLVAQTLHTDDTHYADAALAPLTRANALREPHRNDFDEISGRLRGDLGWATLKITSAAQTHEIETRYDATLAAPQFGAPAGAPTPFDEDSHTDAFVSELTLASPTGGRFEWLGGLFASEFSQATDLALASGGVGLHAETRQDHIDEYAVYGEASWRFRPNLSVTLGARYFQLSVETGSRTTEPGGQAAFEDRRTDHGFAPKVVVRYEPSDRMLFYVQAAEGYRAGGFNTSGRIGQTFPPRLTGPQPYRDFSGDELTNVEAGARLSFLDRRLRVRAALFQARWTNIQTEELLTYGLPFTANIGDGHNQGLEVEARYSDGGLLLEGNVLFNDPELDTTRPDFADLTDKSLPGVARTLIGASGRYEWGKGALRRFASLEVNYVGESILIFGGGVSSRMGDYWATRAAIGVIGERWRLTAYADNLFNSDGDTFAYGNPFSLGVIEQQTPQRPLTVGLMLRRDF